MQSDSFVVYNKKETYLELGSYDFKIVLDPLKFKNSHESEIKMYDSDGKEMKFEVSKWGRKINCKFQIDDTVSDGVAIIDLSLKDTENGFQKTQLRTWIIKP